MHVCLCQCVGERNRKNDVIKVKGKLLAVFRYPKDAYIEEGVRLISEVDSSHMNTNI